MAHEPTPAPPTAPDGPEGRGLFRALTPGGLRNVADTLRDETAGGVLLLLGAVVALVWANSAAADAYEALRGTVVGPSAVHLDLSLATWAKDGLLAIFFFVVGLELKREIVDGELRRPATAALPILGAVGGMLVPAGIYVAVNAASPDGALQGWAIPTATDIAFAVAVLAVFGRALPLALRAFLLTLAVVDDLLAIVVIAIFYSDGLTLGWLAASAAAVALFAVLAQRRITSPLLLLPLALAAWAFMHESGIHATIAGVLLGFTVPALARGGEGESMAARWEHRWRPISAGVAVPVFAFFAAGVALDPESLRAAAGDPVAQGVALGLVVGKPLGIVATTWLVSRVTRTPLAAGLGWRDIVAAGMVAGIGFTVSLLIGELAFAGDDRTEVARAAILVGSLVAAVLGAVLLAARGRHHASKPLPGAAPGL
ncbi:Na+/H+ antiporter NhaA [Cellulomonas carbonis]|uniref:Na(+)/H(+) antiporter NhaA n=1 Tax=Cellulomonas carbonis T26 TaxID=947969 RepID=A0A0A0BVW7_9CELL|nr:Na+/H+ antiporter NhaA [Cellulomonas carbonis]KGM12081.1 Na(+)/H(+) antiporter NhaA [Cellulomonas carbonis T26]GGC08343.1 Na(+)/H(+) antiporter NhaA [Cellulomonas carbonis]